MNKNTEIHMSKKMENHIKRKRDLLRKIGLFIVGVFMLTSIIGSTISSIMATKAQSSVTQTQPVTVSPTTEGVNSTTTTTTK